MHPTVSVQNPSYLLVCRVRYLGACQVHAVAASTTTAAVVVCGPGLASIVGCCAFKAFWQGPDDATHE